MPQAFLQQLGCKQMLEVAVDIQCQAPEVIANIGLLIRIQPDGIMGDS